MNYSTYTGAYTKSNNLKRYQIQVSTPAALFNLDKLEKAILTSKPGTALAILSQGRRAGKSQALSWFYKAFQEGLDKANYKMVVL
tara:strand:- start:41 stop:295 length:255 start_codon:yes stop_codon:yes gene_type:complete